MAWIWTGMVVLSLIFGVLSGNLNAVASAAMAGAQSAIDLSVSMAGMLCLWSGAESLPVGINLLPPEKSWRM